MLYKNKRKAFDDGNIGCGLFVDLQKAFDTVDHQILLLAKLNHYGIRGVSNDWFKSYLSNRHQYVSINGYGIWSCCYKLWCPSGICSTASSIFIICKDLNQATKSCKVHHFADDTKGPSTKNFRIS